MYDMVGFLDEQLLIKDHKVAVVKVDGGVLDGSDLA